MSNPSIIDIGNDDYYGHNQSDIVDVKNSLYLKFFNYTPESVETSSSSASTVLSTIATTSDTNTTTSQLRINYVTLELIISSFLLNGIIKLKKKSR